MQLKWLQMVSKKSEHKARDLKMPQLQKLKREILTRLVNYVINNCCNIGPNNSEYRGVM